MKTSARILLLVYLPAVFAYSVMELAHDCLHFLADHYRSTLHHHAHSHGHSLEDHHVHHHAHVENAAVNQQHHEHEVSLNKVFYPVSYLESNFRFAFINSFLLISRWKHDLPLTSREQIPPTPPPQYPVA